jgi:hypothetical protein
MCCAARLSFCSSVATVYSFRSNGRVVGQRQDLAGERIHHHHRPADGVVEIDGVGQLALDHELQVGVDRGLDRRAGHGGAQRPGQSRECPGNGDLTTSCRPGGRRAARPPTARCRSGPCCRCR